MNFQPCAELLQLRHVVEPVFKDRLPDPALALCTQQGRCQNGLTVGREAWVYVGFHIWDRSDPSAFSEQNGILFFQQFAAGLPQQRRDASHRARIRPSEQDLSAAARRGT